MTVDTNCLTQLYELFSCQAFQAREREAPSLPFYLFSNYYLLVYAILLTDTMKFSDIGKILEHVFFLHFCINRF